MSFLYPFFTFFQPGVFWPELAVVRPMLLLSGLALLVGLARKPEYSRRSVFLSPVFLSLVVFMAAQILSVRHAGRWDIMEEISFWSTPFMFVVISVLLASNPTALKRYVWGMILGGMFIVVYGIYAVYAKLGLAITGRAGAYGVYANHNDYSFIVILILPFIFTYMQAEAGILRRGLLGIFLVTCVAGIFMSLSRGGVLALVLEFALIVLLAMKGNGRLLLLPVLALAGAVAIVYQWHAREENQAGGYTAEDAEESRFELWKAARRMIAAKPLFGVGSRRFAEYAKEYYDLSGNQKGKVAHNTYLEILATSGLVGFGAFMYMWYCFVREMRRKSPYTGPPWVEATRIAALISLYSILFRALLASKSADWGFYALCAIGLACCAMRSVGSVPSAEPGAAAATLRDGDQFPSAVGRPDPR